jgi:hypothetical protein
MLRRNHPDVLPDALIDAAALCVHGCEASRWREERL